MNESMQLDKARRQFIDQWGQLGINWGVNKTMGQVHGLLLVVKDPLCSDQIMCELKISRGNVNMNIRALMDWGLVHKKFIQGERKEYFIAEKDVFKMFKSVIEMRRRKELDPMIKILNEISDVKPRCEDSEEFCKVVRELKHFTKKAESALENITGSERNWLFGSVMKFMK